MYLMHIEFFSFIYITVLLCISFVIKDNFIYAVWNIMFLYLFCGEIIYYQFNSNARLTQPILYQFV